MQIAWVIFGISTVVILISFLSMWFKSYAQRTYLKKKDKRLSYFRNVLKNIEYVKVRALENFYSMKIFEKREEEIKRLNILNVANILMISANFICYRFGTTFFLYYLHYWSDEEITYGKFGEIFALFNPALISCSNLASYVNWIVVKLVSLKRIHRFLVLNSDSRNYIVSREQKESGGNHLALRCTRATFNWHEYLHPEYKLDEPQFTHVLNYNDSMGIENQLKDPLNETLLNSTTSESSETGFSLKNINLTINKGEKVMVFGNASSGKSSLLYALCGEMFPMSQDTIIEKEGEIGFLSEKRFTKGGTLLENICMNLPFDKDRMDFALKASQLVQDLESMNHGIHTVLSDTSDSISGGQKARICLARTFYQQ